MPMSVDEKAVMKAYMSRKLRTLPFFIGIIFSLLLLIVPTFNWVRGQLAWHKTDAEVIMVNEDGGGFYRYVNDRTGESFSGTYYRMRVLMHYQIGKPMELHETIRMAYDPKDPKTHVLFPKLEQEMLIIAIVFVFCFVVYFWLEWVLKKRAKIKIAG